MPGWFALLILGSRWLVQSAVAIAQYLGVSELALPACAVMLYFAIPLTAVTLAIVTLREIRSRIGGGAR